MLSFHINVFAKPREVSAGSNLTLRGVPVSTLNGGESGGPPLFSDPLSVTFEDAQARLLKIPRMDVEPDGYFLVAGGEAEGNRWQIDGHLHELGATLHRAEMHGSCPTTVLDALLGCFGWPDRPLAFELVLEGVTVGEVDFRAWAAANV